MDMDVIINAASDALLNVVLAVIALAGAYGVYFIRLGAAKLKEQTAQIKDEAGRKVLEDALDDVVNLATVSVGAMEQTTAKALRDAVKSGKAKPEELAALGKQVFDEVKAAISPQAQQVITDNLGSFDAYLTKCIENAVLKVKQADPYIPLRRAGGGCGAAGRGRNAVRRGRRGNGSDHRADRRGGLPAVYAGGGGADLFCEADAQRLPQGG